MERERFPAPAARAVRKLGSSSIVMKFGGSSLSSGERIRAVAAKVAAVHADGARVVVVVSAMGDTTDELVALARSVSETPAPRELDVLLSAGERISIALLAMALEARGVPAVSMTGPQCGIRTEGPHTRARIVAIDPARVGSALDAGRVVVVAGFQGLDRSSGDVTTLGRGGSDTTAVAMAAALGAPTCDIHSDVDGVYSADPRVCPAARRLDTIDYDTMQELARQGARVLHSVAVEHARRGGVSIRARATSGSPGRTVITAAERGARAGGVVAVTGRRDLVRVRVIDAGAGEAIRAELGEHVPVLATTHGVRGPELWLVGEELPDVHAFARALESRWPGRAEARAGLGSVAVVGPSAPGADSPWILEPALARLGVAVHARATAPCAATWMLDAEHVDDGVRALHRAAIEDGEQARVPCAS